jgi:hypothetical protein
VVSFSALEHRRRIFLKRSYFVYEISLKYRVVKTEVGSEMENKGAFRERAERILMGHSHKLKGKEKMGKRRRLLLKHCNLCDDGRVYSWPRLLVHIVRQHQSEVRAQSGKLFARGIDIKCVNCQLPVRTDNNICPHCGYNLRRWKDIYTASCMAELWPLVDKKRAEQQKVFPRKK